MHLSMMTSTQILKAMVEADGHIQLLNGPSAEHIIVCRSDGSALLEGDLPREILDDFLPETIIRLAGRSREREACHNLQTYQRREKRREKVIFILRRNSRLWRAGLLIYCADYKCGHWIAVNADQWSEHVRLRLSDLEGTVSTMKDLFFADSEHDVSN